VNKRLGARSVARTAAISLATLAVTTALTGVFAAPAVADPEPSTPISTAPTTSEAPSSSSAPEPSVPPAESSPPEAPNPPAAPAARRGQAEVSLIFEKPSFQTDEDVRFTFKVKNIGSARVAGLQVAHHITGPTDLNIPPGPAPKWPGWGQLGSRPGVTLEPGATFEVKVAGQIRDIEKDTAVVRGFVHDETGFGIGEFDSDVPITKVAGRAEGVVFGDKNGNGRPDDGEQLADIPLTLQYANGPSKYAATSDANGRIDFGDVPAAKYYLGGDVIKGWLFPWEVIQIRQGGKDLLIRGAPPLNGALKASVAFNRYDYKKGQLARLTVTLSNSGSIPLTGIVSECNRNGDAHSVGGGAGWGPLSYFANGVTIAPGQTRTFAVSDPVPDAAFDRGFMSVACDFGYRGVDLDNHVQARDKAPVSGAKAAVFGDVVHNPGQGKPRQGLAGVKVVLVSDGVCPVVGEQTTDAKGHFEFHNVVPGPEYQLYLLPPQGWRIKHGNPTSILVMGPADKPAQVEIEAEPGEAPLPTVPTQVPNCGATATPAPPPGTPGSAGGQSGNTTGLASTGADVLGLGAFALVALALGAGLVFGSRRRRRPAG
jgi:hypothetical protein